MKSLLLATVAFSGLAAQAQAYSITTSQVLPSLASIIAPVPSASTGFGTFTTSQKNGSGTITALSPFQAVGSGGTLSPVVQGGVDYSGASFNSVFGGGSATFTAALDPTFVTGGDTFSFIYGSPDSFNTIVFSGGATPTTVSGTDSEFKTAFSPAGSGYYVTTISGLGSYDAVTLSSTKNSLEFATYNVSSVPLPASLPLFGTAVLALGAFALAKKRSAKVV